MANVGNLPETGVWFESFLPSIRVSSGIREGVAGHDESASVQHVKVGVMARPGEGHDRPVESPRPVRSSPEAPTKEKKVGYSDTTQLQFTVTHDALRSLLHNSPPR